ncbi:MAG: hypothetical protein FJ271_29915 [Planctomycetes bacterium]|nr:hypothetical protein [Planctomycetota bacterium]
MSATFLLMAFACGHSQPAKAVSAAEKKEFLKLLATLPTRGEFFAEEAIPKAAPYTRVLLALTEKDLAKYDLYAFMALSASLMGHKEARQYATANFGNIAHPQIKLSWAIMLFRQGKPPAEVVPFLRKAFDTLPESKFGLGPGYEDFRDQVIRASEAGQAMKIEAVKQHAVKAFPEFGGGLSYTNRDLVFAPGGLIHAVRPHPKLQRGELITFDIAGGKASSRLIPQPAGFKPKFDFPNYFESAGLSVNSAGDLLCSWMIEGNGDHGFAFLKKGDPDFRVKRIASYLMGSPIVPAPDGAWYVVQQSSAFFVIHHVDKDVKLIQIGKFRRSSYSLDARFISANVLHFFGSAGTTHRSLRCIDFDVRDRAVLHEREMLRTERRVEPYCASVLQVGDKSLHYLWGLWDRRDNGEAKGKERSRLDGLYYQAEADAVTIKLGGGYHHRAVAVGDRIIVCYTEESAPNDVSFRGNRSRVDIARNRGFGYCCGWHGCSTDSIGRSVGIAAA